MFSFKDSKHTETNLSWFTAVNKAIEATTREYDEEKDPRLYMYNPVGSDPFPLTQLESVLMSRGAARIEAGHHVQLIITLNGITAWECAIWRE